jgi:hypothetical protein
VSNTSAALTTPTSDPIAMTRRHRSRLRQRFRVGLLALCALLLAQWTLVTHACPVIQAAGAALEWQQVLADEGVHDCHGSAPAESVCVKHCVGDDQVNCNPASMAAATPPAPLVLRLPTIEVHDTSLALSAPTHADATAPPLIILYCVFLV